MDAEVENLLVKQAVVVVPPYQDQFISHLFLVEKRDGSYQPVVNLKPLYSKGTVQDRRSQHDQLQPRNWMCFLDLKDAFLTVPIAKEHHKYLCFLWDGKVYEFTCLPFELYSAPQVFTKLLRPVIAHLHS